MISVQVGSYLLDSTNNVYLSQLDVDSSTPLNPQVFDAANRDGGKLINAYFKTKTLTLKGRITAADFASLNSAIDGLKQAMVGMNLNLDINDGTTCKRYIVTPKSEFEIPRDRTMLTFADWSVDYYAIDPPYALDVTQGGAVNVFTALSNNNITVDLFTSALAFSGSAQPGAKVVVTLTNAGDLYALDIVDISNSRSMNVPYSFSTGDVLVVDLVNYTVQVNGVDVNYTGQLPNWQSVAGQQIGINGYTVSGVNLDQASVSTSAPTAINGTQLFFNTATVIAQNFTPSVTAPISRVAIILAKVGNPTGNVQLTVQADNGSGAPTGTALATYNVAASAISSVFQYINCTFQIQPSLTAATAYWMVVQPTVTGDVNNYFQIRTIAPSTVSGALKKSTNGGSTFTTIANTCLAFKEFRSVVGQQNPNTDYTANDYHELFVNTTSKDAANTTANWVTGTPNGDIQQNGSLVSQHDSFALTNYSYGLNGSNQNYEGGSPWIPTKSGALLSVTIPIFMNGTVDPSGGVSANLRVGATSTSSGSSVVNSTNSIATNTLSSTITNAVFTFPAGTNVTAGANYVFTIVYGGSTFYNLGISAGVLAGSFINNINGNTGGWGNTQANASIDYNANVQYTSYAGQEQAQTVELAATQTDILSVSQVTRTILLGSATYQGQVSVDNGSTWFNIVRDLNPFDTDNIPPAAGTQLKMRWLLQNNAYVTGTDLYWKKGISLDASTKYAAQSFTPTSSGSIASLQLFLAKVGTGAQVNISIQTDSAGAPSGTQVTNGSANVVATAVATSFGWVTFTFGTPITVTGATKYWIVISAVSPSSTNRVLVLANNNGYSTGTAAKSVNSGTSWSGFTSAEDLMFKTFGSAGGNYNLSLQVTYNKRYL